MGTDFADLDFLVWGSDSPFGVVGSAQGFAYTQFGRLDRAYKLPLVARLHLAVAGDVMWVVGCAWHPLEGRHRRSIVISRTGCVVGAAHIAVCIATVAVAGAGRLWGWSRRMCQALVGGHTWIVADGCMGQMRQGEVRCRRECGCWEGRERMVVDKVPEKAAADEAGRWVGRRVVGDIEVRCCEDLIHNERHSKTSIEYYAYLAGLGYNIGWDQLGLDGGLEVGKLLRSYMVVD